MTEIKQQNKKIPLQRLAMVKLSMVDGEVIYSDTDAYTGMQGENVFAAKEYKNQTNDVLKFDSNILINPLCCVCARLVVKMVDLNNNLKADDGDVTNA